MQKRDKGKPKVSDEEVYARIRLHSSPAISDINVVPGEVVSPSEKRHEFRDLKKVGQGCARGCCFVNDGSQCVGRGVHGTDQDRRHGGHQADESADAAQEGMCCST